MFKSFRGKGDIFLYLRQAVDEQRITSVFTSISKGLFIYIIIIVVKVEQYLQFILLVTIFSKGGYARSLHSKKTESIIISRRS